MRSTGRTSWLRLVATETTPAYPSVRFAVDVDNAGFAGSYEEVWVEFDELARFASDLGVCERARDGKAGLTGLSPEEFRIAIERSDAMGHFDAAFTLGRYGYTRRGSSMRSVSGAFDLDSEFLGEMASRAAAIVAWAKADLEAKGRS